LQALRNKQTAEQKASPAINPELVTRATEIPDNYYDQLNLGRLLLQQDNFDLAELFLQKAQQMFPQYAGDDSSYWLLATLYLQQEKYQQAEQQLAAMTAINAEHYAAHWQLAELRTQRGDHAAAAAALEAANYIFPYDLELHEALAGHLASDGLWDAVARERRALLALDPVDKAEAHYQLAYAYERAGNRASAREQILYALEIAPNFYRAQALLLSLQGLDPVPPAAQ
jgi:tetratricopeptide (TPR) repeat protein